MQKCALFVALVVTISHRPHHNDHIRRLVEALGGLPCQAFLTMRMHQASEQIYVCPMRARLMF